MEDEELVWEMMLMVRFECEDWEGEGWKVPMASRYRLD